MKLVVDNGIMGPIEQLLGQDFIWAGSGEQLTVAPELGWHAGRPGEAELDYMRIKIVL